MKPDQQAASPDDAAANRDRLGIWALAVANGISQTGNSMTALAVPWFVLVTTGSASRTGIVGAMVALSPVFAGIVSGPIVDRLGFRESSIISDALSGVTVLLIPLLYLAGWLTFWQLLVLVFLGAFFDVPGHTARSALVPALARRAGMPLERANSILQIAYGTSDAVVAPLLAGVLIAALGAAQVLFIDAGTFAVSILIVGLLIAVKPAAATGSEEPEEDSPAMDRFLAGFRFVLRDRVLQNLLPVAVLFNFVGRAYGGVLLPVYVRDEFDNPTYFGLIISAMGLGMLAGVILYGAYGHRFSRYNTLLAGFTLSAAAVWLFTLPVFLPTDLLGMFFFGLGMGPANPLLQTLLQIRTPERLLGRVLSAIYTLFTVAAPLGVLVAGFAIDLIGVRPVLIVSASLISTAPFWIAFAPWPRRAAPAFEE
ncbi:MAG: MFS transporter [Thermomicrobiales bacterium]